MHRCVGFSRPDPEDESSLITDNCRAYGGNSGGPWVKEPLSGAYSQVGVLHR